MIYLALCSHALCEELSLKYVVLLCTTRAFLLRDRAVHVFAEVRTVALGVYISEQYQLMVHLTTGIPLSLIHI